MKLPWQKPEKTGGSTKVELPATPAKEDERPRPKGYTPPKGRPTPTRQEQEIRRGVRRDPAALSPAQQRLRDKELKKSLSKEEWKTHKRERREKARASTREVQARIDAGDERYLMDRDKGEIRRYVRDWVDARRFFNNYVLPAALVMMVLTFLGTAAPRISVYVSALSLVFMAAIVVEAIAIGVRANRAVRRRFPETTETGFGLGMYAFSRATQPRTWRSPKPRVAVGEAM
ncbi:hypothetical protein CAPI_03875 [Corynebacterium capitovis DSM 44611]|uniref:DUF3043 domain-containing protein n=1 Tax=Corynebacterium capitovis TaxID=131081 RepID=UPI00037C269F|nr:DUF3043 domain-containing protein [Corynebacterium capitovis]WKD57333.1 hypothetical protein CAPI_03875 [Corynebacterium capitovis DSM 44611]